MDLQKHANLFLGIPTLIPEWKKMLTTKYLSQDFFAGITVAFVAIPLSLAIALASGVTPAVGLVTAIIAGIVCAFFGGTPLAVSGPAAAMSVLLADTVQNFGIESLIFMCLIAGLMQLISGMAGLGKLARYVPLPVISGFTAGIGVIILIGQLPRAFGLEPPAESHVLDVFNHFRQYFHEINGDCLLLVVITMAIIRGLPKLLPRLQPILPAVVVATAIVYFFNLNVPTIGAIPNSLPFPHMPGLPNVTMDELLLGAFTIYLLASLETLLSSSAIDKLSGGKKHDSDQELIGQGLGNVAVSFFGGIPVTGVIARSATNVKSGAKTRRASIIHSMGVLLAVFAFAPMMGMVPIAALAGVLFSVAFSMINYREFRELWMTSRSEALIYAVTFFTIISVDLIAGVQAGIIVSAIIVLFKATQTRLHVSKSSYDNVIRLSLKGTLTFLSTGKISNLEKELHHAHSGQTVLLDLTNLENLDTSGASAIIDFYNSCREKSIKFYITGLARRFEPLFKVSGGETFIDDNYLISEHELRKQAPSLTGQSSYGQLIHGFYRYYEERKENDKRLFDYIIKKQNPHTLFITCSDSRIVPSEMTSSNPGDLFIMRNVGNYIPAYDEAESVCHSEFAGLEFSLNALDITDIVVCGHANCGAIQACKHFDSADLPAKLKQWISLIRSQLTIDDSQKLNQIARMNVLNQIKNLKTYPVVKEKLSNGVLKIHAWFYNFDENMVYEWDSKQQKFKSLMRKESAIVSGFNVI
ncbi:MAG TPA: bifunctional SulP family inorganic anion transporter/carbonic anhydrase [Gammaproteobacteria bacterium]|nr:bifunctional SulP family inorganic anion transporter/carbonic anhydrase [Gammaproteobacteria bacterium]